MNEAWKEGFKEGVLEAAQPKDLLKNPHIKELVEALKCYSTHATLGNETYHKLAKEALAKFEGTE